jgi:mRNA interferase MazF
MAARVARGEIRLYQFGQPDKVRPVLILTRHTSIRHLNTVTIAAITSTIRGVASEVYLDQEDGMKKPCAVNFHNLMTVSQDRIGRRIAQLGPGKLNAACAALRFALGCDELLH